MSLSQFWLEIEAAAGDYGLDPNLLGSVINTESAGNPNAVSGVGAIGLGQIMPSTAAAYGVSASQLYDPSTNIDLAAQILSADISQYGSVAAGLADYNGGNANAKAVAAGGTPVSTETQNYLNKILGSGWNLASGGSGVSTVGGTATSAQMAGMATPTCPSIVTNPLGFFQCLLNNLAGQLSLIVLGIFLVLIALAALVWTHRDTVIKTAGQVGKLAATVP